MTSENQPHDDLVIEKDVEIPLRDGVRLRGDVFRPRAAGKYPALINIGAYQKDKVRVPPPDLEEPANPYMNWETVNPLWWVPRGYAAVRVDTRGSGKSPGQTDPFSLQEAIDFYDSIEWAARQPWCSGNVATMGISYFAMTQWLVANLKPPSLKAIVPWEGAADMYRDLAYHGGIFCFGFVANWYNNHMAHHLLARRENPSPDAFSKNWLWDYMRHSLDSDHYRGRQARWDEIDVPLYTVGNWSGMGLHLRGNTEAFMRARSKEKKLRIHAGTHYHPFYAEEARTDQLRFLDHWLKGKDTGIMDEPPVKLLIRTGGGKGYAWRQENEWPLARTQWTRFYLSPVPKGSDAEVEGALEPSAPESRTRSSIRRAGCRKRASPRRRGLRRCLPAACLDWACPSKRNLFAKRLKSRDLSCSTCGSPARRTTWMSSRRSAISTPPGRTSGKSDSSSNPCPSRRAGCGRRIASSIQRSRCPIGLITRMTSASG